MGPGLALLFSAYFPIRASSSCRALSRFQGARRREWPYTWLLCHGFRQLNPSSLGCRGSVFCILGQHDASLSTAPSSTNTHRPSNMPTQFEGPGSQGMTRQGQGVVLVGPALGPGLSRLHLEPQTRRRPCNQEEASEGSQE